MSTLLVILATAAVIGQSLRAPASNGIVAFAPSCPTTPFELRLENDDDAANLHLSHLRSIPTSPPSNVYQSGSDAIEELWVTSASRELEAFIRARNTSEKLRYVERPQSNQSFVQLHTEITHPIEDVHVRFLRESAPPNNGTHFAIFEIQTELNPRGFHMPIRWSEDTGMRINWQLFVQLHEEHLSAFVTRKMETPTNFYLTVKRSHNRHELVRDSAGCFVSGTLPNQWFEARIPSSSSLARRLSDDTAPLQIRASLYWKGKNNLDAPSLSVGDIRALHWNGDAHIKPRQWIEELPLADRVRPISISEALAFYDKLDVGGYNIQLQTIKLMPYDSLRGTAGFVASFSRGEATGRGRNTTSFMLWLKRCPQGLVMDWQTYLQTKQRLWKRFLETRPAKSQVFRVMIERNLLDSTKLILSDPLHGEPVEANLDDALALTERLELLIEKRATTLELAWRHGQLMILRRL